MGFPPPDGGGRLCRPRGVGNPTISEGERMALQTEFEFTLPRGYVDKDGNLHKKGIMRLATAKDEIAPLTDFRVQKNRAYLVIILLSRVIGKLGDMKEITTDV